MNKWYIVWVKLVEARGIEPLSEDFHLKLSTGVDYDLTSPYHIRPQSGLCRGSFIHTDYAAKLKHNPFTADVTPLTEPQSSAAGMEAA